MKRISILGSTGSIGVNTLKIIKEHPEKFSVKVLAARRNAELLAAQAEEFKPELVCLFDRAKAADLEKKLKPLGIRLVTGPDGLIEAACHRNVDQVVFAVVGACGLLPIFTALKAGKAIAVANKEPLVMAGALLMEMSRRLKTPVLPIDSEHSGLWQCLDGRDPKTVKKLILTSSGGPFRGYKGDLASVTTEQALKHPKWQMGPKITIDSATLMNKGLEVIEAANLFGVSSDRVEVMVHPEAVVHAMVEFVDGTHLANLAIADMRLPIQYALSYPSRFEQNLPGLDLIQAGALHFEKPDRNRFPCLEFGYEASRAGGTMPAVLNAANEESVDAFLNRNIRFSDIPRIIEDVMKHHRVLPEPELEQILEADRWAREEARGRLGRNGNAAAGNKVKKVNETAWA